MKKLKKVHLKFNNPKNISFDLNHLYTRRANQIANQSLNISYHHEKINEVFTPLFPPKIRIFPNGNQLKKMYFLNTSLLEKAFIKQREQNEREEKANIQNLNNSLREKIKKNFLKKKIRKLLNKPNCVDNERQLFIKKINSQKINLEYNPRKTNSSLSLPDILNASQIIEAQCISNKFIKERIFS